MNSAIAKTSLKPRFVALMLIGLLLVSCIKIIDPKDGTTVPQPVAAKVEIQSQCGPFQAYLDGADVTSQFSSSTPFETNNLRSPSDPTGPLSEGSHKLQVSAGTRNGWMTCGTSKATSDFIVRPDTKYMKQCREQEVPIPPDLILNVTPNQTTAWEFIGALGVLNESYNIAGVPGDSAEVYAYGDPMKRGACIALLRYGVGPQIGVICQSAATGRSCFWNKDEEAPKGDHPGVHPRVPIETLDDPMGSGKTHGIIHDDCTACHRGNNAFILFPDDPVWKKVLKGPLVTKAGSTFTTKVEHSTATDDRGRFRHIPLGGGLFNPPGINVSLVYPKCSDGCHEIQVRLNQSDRFTEMLVKTALPGQAYYPNMPPQSP